MTADEIDYERLYESFVHEHADELYRVAYRLTGHHQQAEDLVQETFLEAWRSMASLRDTGKARGWLLAILRHRYARWRHESGQRPQLAEETGLEDVPVEVPEREPDCASLGEPLQSALDAMDDRFKLPLMLVLLQGLSCSEAAAALEVPLGTVLSRLHRARSFLRQRVGQVQRPEGIIALRREERS